MNYIIGKIVYIGKNYVVAENNFMGFKIYVNELNEFEIDKYKKIYIIEKISISNNFINSEMYGFTSLKNKIFFENLISISGIGHKTAFSIMKNDINEIKTLIKNSDVQSLSKMEGISSKIASILVTQYKYDIDIEENISTKKNYKKDVISALKSLGYSLEDINNTLNNKFKNDDFFLENEEQLSDLISMTIKEISVNV